MFGPAPARVRFAVNPLLSNCKKQAQEHLEKLKLESESESKRIAGHARRKAAQTRAAEDQAKRIEEALKQHAELSQRREKRAKEVVKKHVSVRPIQMLAI